MNTAKGMKVGYIRVSSSGQNTDRQTDGLSNLNLDKVFTDKLSGASTDRPELKACLEYLRENDTLYIYSMDSRATFYRLMKELKMQEQAA